MSENKKLDSELTEAFYYFSRSELTMEEAEEKVLKLTPLLLDIFKRNPILAFRGIDWYNKEMKHDE